MKIYGVSLYDCQGIAIRLGITFDGEDVSNSRGIRTSGRLRGSATNPYPRLGNARNADGARRWMPSAVCWHGYRDFMRAVFELDPSARIITGSADYRGRDDFEAIYRGTGMRNIGSMGDPMTFAQACYCKDAGEAI